MTKEKKNRVPSLKDKEHDPLRLKKNVKSYTHPSMGFEVHANHSTI